jgi:hypothetical protein
MRKNAMNYDARLDADHTWQAEAGASLPAFRAARR